MYLSVRIDVDAANGFRKIHSYYPRPIKTAANLGIAWTHHLHRTSLVDNADVLIENPRNCCIQRDVLRVSVGRVGSLGGKSHGTEGVNSQTTGA